MEKKLNEPKQNANAQSIEVEFLTGKGLTKEEANDVAMQMASHGWLEQEERYEVIVVSMNRDGSYDAQSPQMFDNLADAEAAYNETKLAMETDKILVDIKGNKVLKATNEALL